MTTRNRLRWLQRGLLVLGLLLLTLWSTRFLESRRYQSVQSEKLDKALREAERDPSGGFRRSAVYAAPGSRGPSETTLAKGILGRIEIPRLSVAAIVAEGADAKTLSRAIGHVSSTALPGEPGNCALAGHRDTFLRGLRDVKVDDVIQIVTLERTYTYQVEWTVVVDPHRVDVLDSTSTRSLTLVTCFPFAYVGHAPKRFIVRARQVDIGAGLEGAAGGLDAPPMSTLIPRRDGTRAGTSLTNRAISRRGGSQP